MALKKDLLKRIYRDPEKGLLKRIGVGVLEPLTGIAPLEARKGRVLCRVGRTLMR